MPYINTDGGFAGGAARGLEAGLSLGEHLSQQAIDNQRQAHLDQLAEQRQAHLNQINEQQRQFENNLATQREARAADTAQRQKNVDALDAINAETEEATHALAANHYQNQDPESQRAIQAQLGQHLLKLQASRRDIYAQLDGGRSLNAQQQAQQHMQDLGAGKLTIHQLGDEQFGQDWSLLTHRPVSDFLPDATGKSAIGRGVEDFEAGIGGDQDRLLRGANTLLKPYLDGFVGKVGHDGSRITGAEVTQFVPNPNDPRHVIPAIRLSTLNQAGHAGTQTVLLTEDPDHATLHSEDTGNAALQNFEMGDLFHRVGILKTLDAAAQQPEIRQKLAAGNTQQQADLNAQYNRFFSYLGRNESDYAPRHHTEVHGHTAVTTDAHGGIVKTTPLPLSAMAAQRQARADGGAGGGAPQAGGLQLPHPSLQPVAPPAVSAANLPGVYSVSNAADHASLPSGAQYSDPDGALRVKR
jgi:hypothetical protein